MPCHSDFCYLLLLIWRLNDTEYRTVYKFLVGPIGLTSNEEPPLILAASYSDWGYSEG
jgi:hypothetical protein